ncbi:MAG: signal peptidase I [bacterium]|nr:MAG: signal peptidase I [bacterium]
MDTAAKVDRAKGKFREYAEAIVLALILALIIRTFVVQAFKIPSPSMVPTLLVGDHILVNKFLYGFRVPLTDRKVLAFRKPRRGDVIVFRYPRDRKLDFIKRCIALEGETLTIEDKRVYIDGELIDDGHAYFTDRDGSPITGRDNLGPLTVPEGKVFVMGDNRDNSNDSRFWGFVDLADVKGKAMVIYWSWDRSRKWPRFGRMGDGIE